MFPGPHPLSLPPPIAYPPLGTGAASVRLYDQEPLALQCALLSAQLNGVPVVQQDPGPPSIELMPDSWWDCLGEGPPRPAAEGCTPVCAAQYDWNSGLGLAPADLVLACDVLYDSAFVEVGEGWQKGGEGAGGESCLGTAAGLTKSILGACDCRELWAWDVPPTPHSFTFVR